MKQKEPTIEAMMGDPRVLVKTMKIGVLKSYEGKTHNRLCKVWGRGEGLERRCGGFRMGRVSAWAMISAT